MKTLFKEPLLHFLFLGAALFCFYAVVAEPDISDKKIVISDAKLIQLKYSFEQTRLRPPTEQEFNALLTNYLKEQVAYKKGIEMGLMQGDGIIQKRLQQKLEFIVEAMVTEMEPTDAQLAEYLQQHQGEYKTELSFTFKQYYFNPQQHEDVSLVMHNAMQTLSVATTNVGENNREGNNAVLSDSIFLQAQYQQLSYHQVARAFGSDFAKALKTMPIDNWHQGIKSGYGLHLVKVLQKQGGKAQVLAQVRAKVKAAWMNQQREQGLEEYYQTLFNEYQVEFNS